MLARSLSSVYSLSLKVQLAGVERLLSSLEVGSLPWHLVQHRLSRWSSASWPVRSKFLEVTLPECGPDLCVFPDTVLYYPENVRIGAQVFINRNVFISAPAPIYIGDYALIGPNVVINSGNHRYRDPDRPIRQQGHELRPITIANDVWIGAGSTVLAGASIGHGAVVAAGAVVRGTVEPWSVVGGVPARSIAPSRLEERG